VHTWAHGRRSALKWHLLWTSLDPDLFLKENTRKSCQRIRSQDDANQIQIPQYCCAAVTPVHKNERNIAMPFGPAAVYAINADSSPCASGDWFAGVNLATFATGFALTARSIEVEEALAHETQTPERLQRCSRGIWTEWLTWKLQNGKRPVCATMQRIFQRRRIRTLRLVWALMAALALSLAVCSAIFTVWTLRQTRDLSRSFQTLQERLEQVNAMARVLSFLSLKCMTDAYSSTFVKQFTLIMQWFAITLLWSWPWKLFASSFYGGGRLYYKECKHIISRHLIIQTYSCGTAGGLRDAFYDPSRLCARGAVSYGLFSF